MSTVNGIGFSDQQLASFQKQFKRFNEKKTAKLQDATMQSLYNMLSVAKIKVPRYQNRLQDSLREKHSTNKLSGIVFTNVKYAPYVEFGTKSKVKIPAEIAQYAAQFKGKGSGDLDEFFEQIYKWVKKKNIGGNFTASGKASKSKSSQAAVSQAAWFIAMSILKKGIKAQPFLYPAFKAEIPKYVQAIKTIMNQEETR